MTVAGTKRLKNLEENLQALHVSLSPSEVEQLSNAIPQNQVSHLKAAVRDHLESSKCVKVDSLMYKQTPARAQQSRSRSLYQGILT